MEFWSSAEVHKPAFTGLNAVRLSVEPFLNSALAASDLAKLNGELRYIPIIMPEGMRERYPARSRLDKTERIYSCSPQLDYDVFVEGTFEEQLEEYLRGVAESAPHLADLGATPQQIVQFENIIAGAAQRILAERPDQTRH